MTAPRRILVLDDSSLAHFALAQALNHTDDLELIAETHSLQEAVRLVQTHCPDIAVLDLYLPYGNGIMACRQIRTICPKTSLLILTNSDQDTYLVQAKRAGAMGFLSKASSPEMIVEAIRQAASGRRLWTNEQINRIDVWEETLGYRLDSITKREQEVLWLVALGKTNPEIIEALKIQHKTLNNHLTALHQKLGVNSHAQLVAFFHLNHLEFWVRIEEFPITE